MGNIFLKKCPIISTKKCGKTNQLTISGYAPTPKIKCQIYLGAFMPAEAKTAPMLISENNHSDNYF
jgi:hypothetical protein